MPGLRVREVQQRHSQAARVAECEVRSVGLAHRASSRSDVPSESPARGLYRKMRGRVNRSGNVGGSNFSEDGAMRRPGRYPAEVRERAVAGWEGGTDAWIASGRHVASAEFVDAARERRALSEGAANLDVRDLVRQALSDHQPRLLVPEGGQVPGPRCRDAADLRARRRGPRTVLGAHAARGRPRG